MKKIIVFLLFALLLCDCSEIENREEDRELVFKTVDTTYFVRQGATLESIFVSPKRSISIGKEGGIVEVTAYYLDTLVNGTQSNRILNDFFFETINFDAPFVSYEGRKRISDREVRYTFLFTKNETGMTRPVIAAAISDTLSHPSGFGWFSITQKAD